MALLRAWWSLFQLSLWRTVRSLNTAMVLLPLVGGGLFVLRRGFGDIDDPARAFDRFSDFLILVFASFLIPLCAIAFGAASIGGDREDRTLVFLLVRPIPRPLILLAKFLTGLPITAALVVATLYCYCRMAGEPGQVAFPIYLPAVLYMTVAYVALFQLFAVTFRYATMVSLVYAFFFEFFLGNMPGIIKRVAINYYGRSLLYGVGEPHGVKPPDPRWFEPLEAATCVNALLGISVVCLIFGLVVFSRREYRDLT